MTSSNKPSILRLSKASERSIIDKARSLHSVGIRHGIGNILQPGLVKEIIIASVLDHSVITNKRLPDACSKSDESKCYEYLTCEEGGTWQIDRMFRDPSRRAKSLRRIDRNEQLYFAMFKKNCLELISIYEVDVQLALSEANRQLDASQNDISHVSFSHSWTRTNGRVVFPLSQS